MASAPPQFPFTLLSPIADRQALRTRRFFLGVLAYAVGVVLLGLATMVDLLTPQGFALSVALVAAWNGALFWLFASGANAQFRDKSLTHVQTLGGIAVIMFVAYQFQRDRSLVLVWCLVVLLFGIFRFRTREFVTSTLFMLAGYALVINLLMTFRPQSVDVYLEWYQWAWLALILPAVALVGARISALRDRLVRANDELTNALGTIQRMATHDSLTGLPNRASLTDTMQHLIADADRSGRRFGLLFIDLDHFKAINDTLGHPTGDQLLREAARRLRTSVRESDLVARLGGDEFVIMANDAGDRDSLGLLADKLLASLSQPVVLEGHEVKVTASIGMASFPDDGHDVPTLLSNADMAMYKAKSTGRDRRIAYSSDLGEHALERFEVEKGLRRALQDNELRLFYQPKIDFQSGRMLGVEALIRWQHPDHGLLLPDRFIRVAEESNFIIPLGQWVLQTACRQIRAWQDARLPRFSVAVNLSSKQISDDGFLSHLQSILRTTGADAGLLELEITESMVMEDPAKSARLLANLRGLGVKLSIDDFGTGYSSLSYLKQLPVDTLKVDRGFVKDLPHNRDDLAITRAVIAMAHSLSMRVVAEGVEDQKQFDLLKLEGCDEFQGYLCRPAVSSTDLESLVRRHGLSIPLSG
ncbi:MAG: EAL domain-containing protein [Betaproteobacteria bacterium]|nr:EAL domain-containing protein [Betaproteobacteria bacterium]